jgi:hypothetical protein
MDPQSFLDDYIKPAAQAMGVDTLPHLQIGFGTVGQESGFKDVTQDGGGPALGPVQMEPGTHSSLWVNFISYRSKIMAALNEILGRAPDDDSVPSVNNLMTNLAYACAMMYVRYLDAPGAIPEDLQGQAYYYVVHYNAGGKATTQEYVDNWNRFSSNVNFS